MKIKPSKKPGNVVVEVATKDTALLAQGNASQFRLTKILVPIDFSDCSKKALQYALAFAKQFHTSLVLLYVVETNYAGTEYGSLDYVLLEKESRETGQKLLADLAQTVVGNSAPVETLVRSGRPVMEITDVAKEKNVDLIIISTHGHTGLKHILLGSVSENVVRHAPCPVLTVREREHEFLAPGVVTMQ